jgi:hypothetical protein
MKKKQVKKLALQRSTVSNLDNQKKAGIMGGINTDTFPRRSCVRACPTDDTCNTNCGQATCASCVATCLNTCANTCNVTCVSCFGTCGENTCGITCFDSCTCPI